MKQTSKLQCLTTAELYFSSSNDPLTVFLVGCQFFTWLFTGFQSYLYCHSIIPQDFIIFHIQPLNGWSICFLTADQKEIHITSRHIPLFRNRDMNTPRCKQEEANKLQPLSGQLSLNNVVAYHKFVWTVYYFCDSYRILKKNNFFQCYSASDINLSYMHFVFLCWYMFLYGHFSFSTFLRCMGWKLQCRDAHKRPLTSSDPRSAFEYVKMISVSNYLTHLYTAILSHIDPTVLKDNAAWAHLNFYCWFSHYKQKDTMELKGIQLRKHSMFI